MFRTLQRKLVHVALVALVAPAVASAQVTTTMDFSALQPFGSYAPLPQTFGDVLGLLDVSSATKEGFGNTADICGSVSLWNDGYSDLSAAVFACGNGRVGQLSFNPLAGQSVTLQKLRLGSYASSQGVGPDRNIDLRVYNADFSSVLFSFVGVVNSGVNISPNITSTAEIHLQWGTDWNTGVNLITTTVRDPNVAVVPEPSTVVLLAGGLIAMGVGMRRRSSIA